VEVVDESLVEVTATKVAIKGGTLDGELTLLELGDGARVAAVADVNEGDAARLLIGAGKIQLGDAVAKGAGRCVVD